MLNINQKKVIYDFVLKEFTISSTNFVANCIYENQFLPLRQKVALAQEPEEIGYPLVSLDYGESSIEVISLPDSTIWNSLILEVNFYAKDYDRRPAGNFINGQIIVNEMLRLSMTHINSNFNSNATVKAQNVRLHKNVNKGRDLSQIAGEHHVYRQMVEVPIIYKIE